MVATGARAFRPNLPGLDDYGYSAWEVLQGTEVPGNALLVIDEEYGYQGLSAAEYLLDRGKQVQLVTSERTMGSPGLDDRPPGPPAAVPQGRPAALQPAGDAARGQPGHRPQRLERARGGARAVRRVRLRLRRRGGLRPGEALKGKVARVELIGDCFAPRSLQHAILEGHKFAREL